MDTEGLSIICAGIGCPEEDENGALVGYTKGEYCLGRISHSRSFITRIRYFLLVDKMGSFGR